MVAWMIDAFGSDEQRSRWLPGLMTMERLASYCLTEPGSGSDAASLRTRAERTGEVYRAERQQGVHLRRRRQRPLCLHGAHRRRGAERHQLPGGRAAARLGSASASRRRSWAGSSQPTAMVIFEDCAVPAANRIGAEGEGFRIAMRGLDGGRVNIAACSLGAARACYEKARGHLLERRQFGQPLAEFQALAVPSRRHGDRARSGAADGPSRRRALDRGAADATMACAMAKRFATDIAFEVCNHALAVAWRLRLHPRLRDRALPARRAGAPDPRGHQRDHAGDHRPATARA